MSKSASRASSTRPASPRAARPATQPAARSATQPVAEPASPPATLRLAAAIHLAEAAGMLAVTGICAAATASGAATRTGNGAGIAVLAFCFALGLAGLAVGLAKVRPWTRTPAVMCQFFVIVGAFVLMNGHRLWCIAAIVLAVATLAGLFAPPSLKALNRD
ncbi:MAG TPA: hypothetical protein VN969_19935 [Streptosporangiaceae bacterium]|nr:hypothetical protein [Streptosporangiaceae bacterium]